MSNEKMNNTLQEPLYTMIEVSQFLGISTQTLKKREAKGDISAIRVGKKNERKFKKSEVLKLKKQYEKR